MCIAVLCEDPARVMPSNSLVSKALNRSAGVIYVQGSSQTQNLNDMREFGTNFTAKCRDGYILPDGSNSRQFHCTAVTTVGIWLMFETTKYDACVRMHSC